MTGSKKEKLKALLARLEKYPIHLCSSIGKRELQEVYSVPVLLIDK